MKHRQFITYIITLIFTALFSCANPAGPATSQFTVTIKGTVVRRNFTPLDSVQIVTSNPFRRDSSKANGSFTISFTSSEKSDVNATLTFSRIGWFDTLVAVTYSSTVKDINLQAVAMRGLTAAQDSGGQIRPSLRAGAIVYVGSSAPHLSIYGAGGTDAVTLTFEVRDSLGNPVDTSNQTLVRFRFANTPPDTLTQLSRRSTKTGSNGRATVIMGSGLRAGLASVQAYAYVKQVVDTTKLDTIKSPVVSIPIFGGFPDSAHFSLGTAKVNIPGGALTGVRTQITAIVGDKYGNPSQPGTVVLFTTSGGIIFPAASVTAEDGSVTTQLISGNPIPPLGVATVTAQLNSGEGVSAAGPAAVGRAAVDGTPKKAVRMTAAAQSFNKRRSVAKVVEDAKSSSRDTRKSLESRAAAVEDNAAAASPTSKTFSRTVDVMFSGVTRITIPDTSLDILAKGQKQIDYIVSDIYGNPLTGGTNIKVSTTGSGATNVELTGDLEKTLPDTRDKRYTSFTVYAKDKRTTGLTQDEKFSLTFTVTSDNGNQTRTINGKLVRSGVSDSGRVALIAVVDRKVDTITVAGGGGVQSQLMRFQVLNVNNKPTAGVPIQFEMTKTAGGGEYLAPTVATSDDSGLVQTTLFAGIRAGLVQIVAKSRKDTVTISSDPKTFYIRTGSLASLNLFFISSNGLSVKGSGGNESSLMIFEGRDSLGNPIDASNATTIKFSFQGDTTARLSPAAAKTDPATGRVTATFTSGIKSGIAYIIASGRSDSVKSTPVQIAISGGLPDSLHFSIGPEKLNIPGLVTFNLTDKINVVAGDKYGNPAQAGSVISFTTTGGVVQSPAITSVEGKASVVLTTGNPLPASGLAVITAQIGASGNSPSVGGRAAARSAAAVDEQTSGGRLSSGAIAATGAFTRSTVVLFSGKTSISSPDTNFLVPSGGSRIVNYTVADENGNPLTSGSTVQVSVIGAGSSDVELSGDINRTFLDTQDKLATRFALSVKDKRTTSLDKIEDVSLKIDVVSANGNQSKVVVGRMGGGAASDSGKVGAITLVNNQPDTVVVSGGGGSSSKQVQFKVVDVFNQPAKSIPINFEFTKSVNGGEYLSPVSAVTDAGGLVTVTFTSGTRAGNIQFVARFKRDSSSSITSSPKSIYIRTGSIASIALIGASPQQLSIRGVGGNESATIIYEGRDSLGNAIDFASQTSIRFKLQGDTTGGTYVSPNPAVTDPMTGRVITTLNSGTRAGVVQVYASAKSDSVRSLPVPFTILSGPPDDAHFSFFIGDSSRRRNLPLDPLNPSDPPSLSLWVAAGDTFGNPARVGTAVYFTTNMGYVVFSNALNSEGKATADWKYALKPVPNPDSGFATARTVDRWGRFVQDTIRVIWSGTPVISSSDTNFTIAVGSTKQINFTVSDANKNPLASGQTITLSVSGPGASDVALTGDISVAMPDTKDKALTKFHAFLRDLRATSVTKNEALDLKISVAGPNGSNSMTLNGTLLGTGGGIIDSSLVGRIVLQNPAPESVVVAGIGGIKTRDALFKVYNTFGLPAKNVLVTFSFSKSLGGGEYFSPITALSDTGGNVKTTLTSGTSYGEVRIVATAKRDSLTILSDAKVIYIVIPPAARLASQIAFLGATESDIFVAGVGGKENSIISYEVRDSLGFPIDRQRRVFVTYTVQFFPNSLVGGGTAPTVIPSTDSTDDQGRTRTTVISGTEAGVVQIVVNIQLPNRPLLVSQPVKISVHAGFADQGHFTLIPDRHVFEGFSPGPPTFGARKFTAVVGDTFSNPVQSGTAVYFHSQAGVIQTGSSDFNAYTDASGFATVTLFPSNPTPDPTGTLRAGRPTYDTTFTQGRSGAHWVWAQTRGRGGKLIIDSVLVVQAKAPITVVGIPTTTVAVPSKSVSAPISITIKDGNGNPLPDGTTITSSIVVANAPIGFQMGVSGDISSDIASIIPNAAYARFPGPRITDFTFRVVDQSTAAFPGVTVSVRITVACPDPGIGTATYSFNAQIQ